MDYIKSLHPPGNIKSDLTRLEDWADKCNLAINPTNTPFTPTNMFY